MGDFTTTVRLGRGEETPVPMDIIVQESSVTLRIPAAAGSSGLLMAEIYVEYHDGVVTVYVWNGESLEGDGEPVSSVTLLEIGDLATGIEGANTGKEPGGDGQPVTLQLASDNRPSCPACGKGLYAELEERVTRTIPAWQGEEGPYDGFYADSFEGDTSSEMVRLYCSCGWAIDPREVEVEVEQ